MTDTFKQFADAVNKRFTSMSKNELYVVGELMSDGTPVDAPIMKDKLWETYLASFPEGTNPKFRERREHDCSTCRNFVKNLGNVVEIVNGEVRTLWGGILGSEDVYQVVTDALDDYVLTLPLTGLFRTSERTYGAQKTNALNATTGNVESWNHFWGRIADKHFTKDVGPVRSNFDAAVQVLGRGLEELFPSAVDTVIDLIDSNSLYRGEEHLPAVVEFRSLHNQYLQLLASYRRAFVFSNAFSPAARFRNTVIGTLVDDLSKGVGLEDAVRSFEAKVAPTNYKRPKALITPNMIKDAMKTINALGIEESLERRFARLSDVSVNNVLWVNNDTQSQMKDGIEGLLLAGLSPTGRIPKGDPEPVSIITFMKDILPGASDVSLLVKNSHEPNFVSLTKGVHADSPCIFKWDNDFAWSYGGNVTDSIKEKVKRAGGSVTGKLRVSLSWFNYDDLDIHIYEPDGNHIWYGAKGSIRGGQLDVDMNAGGDHSREPVENVTWVREAKDGEYRVVVNQYHQRESTDVGFVIETESNGNIENYSYDKRVVGDVEVGRMEVRNGVIVAFKPGKEIHGGRVSREIWGVKTEQFVPVSTLLYSPNHWDSQAVGNRHYLFMLTGCLSDQPTRGIFNEFLKNDLDKHRKVFEVLGDRTKAQPTDDQLSGLGFSSTGGGYITARCKMTTDRMRFVEIQF